MIRRWSMSPLSATRDWEKLGHFCPNKYRHCSICYWFFYKRDNFNLDSTHQVGQVTNKERDTGEHRELQAYGEQQGWETPPHKQGPPAELRETGSRGHRKRLLTKHLHCREAVYSLTHSHIHTIAKHPILLCSSATHNAAAMLEMAPTMSRTSSTWHQPGHIYTPFKLLSLHIPWDPIRVYTTVLRPRVVVHLTLPFCVCPLLWRLQC